MDAPPPETVASSESLPEDVDIKEEKVEESPTPAVAQPPHTSPDLSFASEVTSPSSKLQQKIEDHIKWRECINIKLNVSFLQGLLRVILVEAQSLVAKDNMMGGMVKGKSDPYAKISVGEFAFKSNVIKENLNPVWNEMYEVRVWRHRSEQDFKKKKKKKDDGSHLLFMNVSALCSLRCCWGLSLNRSKCK